MPWSGGGGGGARVEEGGTTCGSHPGALPRLAGGELLVLCEAAVVGVEGGAVTLGWGRHARSTDIPRLARTSRRGGRSSCAARAWPGALARASSLLRGRGEAWEMLSAGA